MRRVKVFILLILASGAFAFGAFNVTHAKKETPHGGLWPSRESLTYYDSTSRPGEIRMAAEAWTRVDGVPDLVEVSEPEEADVLIEEMPSEEIDEVCSNPCLGRVSHIGFIPGLQSKIMMRETPLRGFSLSYLSTASHEFGHVLGLKHVGDECALMSNADDQCPMLLMKYRGGTLSSCGPLPSDVNRIPGASGWGGWCFSRFLPAEMTSNYWFEIAEVIPRQSPSGELLLQQVDAQHQAEFHVRQYGLPVPGRSSGTLREMPD